MSSSSTQIVSPSQRIEVLIAGLAILTVLALFYAPSVLIISSAVIAVLYVFERPFDLLLLIAFLIPFNFVFVVWDVPVAAELLKVFIWGPFLFLLIRAKQPFIRSVYEKPLLVVLSLLLLSCFRAISLPATLKEVLRTGSSIGLCFIVVNVVDTREKLATLARMIAISSFLVALYGFYQFAIQDFGALFWIVNPRLDTALSPNRVAFEEWRNRITSVLTSEMELGHYFNYCIPLTAALGFTARSTAKAWVWRFVTLALIVGLLLTFTFAAWIALIVSCAIFAFYFRRYLGRRNVTLIGGLVVGFVIFGFLSLNLTELLSDKIGQLALDYFTRANLWALALQAFVQHPILGIGVGNFAPLTLSAGFEWLSQEWVTGGTTPHNMYLLTASQLGLAGLICLFAVFVHAVISNLRASRAQANRVTRSYAVAVGLSLTSFLIAGLADDSPLYGPHTSSLIWLLLGMSEALRRTTATNESRSFDA